MPIETSTTTPPEITAPPTMRITKQQQSAVDSVIDSGDPVVSISGPAGSGKTTIIAELDSGNVAIVAFTNAAAKVLQRKGLAATTIHSKFYMPERYRDDKGQYRTKFWACDEYPGKLPDGKQTWSDTIIVDEASMLAYRNLRDLRRMCDKLILVGDGNQLAPVGDGQYPRGYFNTMTHTAVLTEVHRQTAGNPVLEMATRLRERKIGPLDPGVFAQFMLPSGATLESRIKSLDAQENTWRIVTFTNRTRQRYNHQVRKHYGFADKVAPQPGELMVSSVNLNDIIVNGTFLEVVSAELPVGEPQPTKAWLYGVVRVRVVDGGQTIHTVRFSMGDYLSGFSQYSSVAAALRTLESKEEEDKFVASLDFGYAVTCHKAQGSEFDHVFVVDERRSVFGVSKGAFENSGADDPMPPGEAVRRWAYTAMTRTRGGLTVLGVGA